MTSKVERVWALVVVNDDGGESLLTQFFPDHHAVAPTLLTEESARNRYLHEAQNVADQMGRPARVIELVYNRELQYFRPSTAHQPS